MILTDTQREALNLRRSELGICAALGPLTRPALDQLVAFGMPADEACNYIIEWDQTRADRAHARNLAELEALTAVVAAQDIAPAPDERLVALNVRLALALEAVLDECDHGADGLSDLTFTEAVAALHQHAQASA